MLPVRAARVPLRIRARRIPLDPPLLWASWPGFQPASLNSSQTCWYSGVSAPNSGSPFCSDQGKAPWVDWRQACPIRQGLPRSTQSRGTIVCYVYDS